ncbi:hypothetical protein [Microbispora sp. NPDC049125]|uniref:hypothetical protein n=1 Tax=Microbispora sp. NPDC049125 TaxID=3154929 RepID=UPI003466D04F
MPRNAPAPAIQGFVDRHAIGGPDWNGPHTFATVTWDGSDLGVHTWVSITTDVHPGQYPKVITRFSRDAVIEANRARANGVEPNLYGYLLVAEFWRAPEPRWDAPAKAHRRWDADRRNRTFHARTDAVETRIAMFADIDGRAWMTELERRTRALRRHFFEGYLDGPRTVGGPFLSVLAASARATGVFAYGDPMPEGYEPSPHA